MRTWGELDGTDVTRGQPQLAELVGGRAPRRVAGTDGEALREQGDIALAGRTIIREVAQAGLTGQIGGSSDAPHGTAEEVMATREARAITIRTAFR